MERSTYYTVESLRILGEFFFEQSRWPQKPTVGKCRDFGERASERSSALLPVVSMHCLVLYCYLLASTKRGNESEAGMATWPAGQGSHNNIAPFRPTSTDCADGRGRGHTQTQRRCSAAAVVSSPPLSSSPPSPPPPTHSAVWTNGRWRQISQEQNGCNAMALKSRVEGAAAP